MRRRRLMFDLIMGGLVTVALLVYLVYALMRAEEL
ncbi:K(+)-transporting ATPase subunit F [Moorella naiadis]